MNQRQKGAVAIGLIAGLAAIIGTGIYLKSEAGRKFMADANKRLQSGKKK